MSPPHSKPIGTTGTSVFRTLTWDAWMEVRAAGNFVRISLNYIYCFTINNFPKRTTNGWRAWRRIDECLLTCLGKGDYPCRAYEGCVCSSKQRRANVRIRPQLFFFFDVRFWVRRELRVLWWQSCLHTLLFYCDILSSQKRLFS